MSTGQQKKQRTPVWITVVSALIIGLGWLVFESGALDKVLATDSGAPSTASAGAASEQLADLQVKPAGSMDGYSRKSFEHWIPAPEAGKNCNTREAVLVRDGTDVQVDNSCEATSGSWVSTYSGETVADDSDVDIDHMVPLANAWRSGANEWTAERREQFANDMDLPQLVAADKSSNRSKGDKDPSKWKPVEAAWCEYATDWVTVKHGYGLSVTAEEKSALEQMLATCG
ncbi:MULTISPECIES: HNH endonuclease family protein [Saccharopolyspora]|nr:MULTISPECIES: HNH endonuclease family protein [Saccharopolyspora]MCA1188251.1 HNH endonuclease family protein [Saccharopolyspora sp. 6T]MCA1194035.1 HNH endonuclease family protein [Saccharopolyspora sp. 6V]MCA1225629.1 HNH endonuclease family protein [Saccharopolyspora sp. 6M]MCA1281510.1 HNH endonuclease family protein [Saccharopolyspora sp. 7B]